MNESRSPESLRLSAIALRSWAFTEDPAARTAPAREAFNGRFEREVDPELRLSPEDRARRAGQLRTAYFRELAAKSALARRAAKQQIDLARAAEAELRSLRRSGARDD